MSCPRAPPLLLPAHSAQKLLPGPVQIVEAEAGGEGQAEGCAGDERETTEHDEPAAAAAGAVFEPPPGGLRQGVEVAAGQGGGIEQYERDVAVADQQVGRLEHVRRAAAADPQHPRAGGGRERRGVETVRAIDPDEFRVRRGRVRISQQAGEQQRAEAAVIAWMRHQTTAYDNMQIPREKGMRREVRRMLADRSRRLLGSYRRGDAVEASCPLQKALAQPAPAAEA